jgi:hypothetical protein
MHIGIIAGSVGGICLLVCAIAAIFVLWRRSRGDISIDSNAGSAIMYSSNSGGIVSARGDEYGAVNFGASEYDVGDVGQSEGYVNGRDLLAHGRVNYPALT